MITLSELRTRCKQQADMENSYFIKDPEWNFMINESYKTLYDMLVTVWENYFINKLEFDLTQDNPNYDIPDDFYKLRGIDVQFNNGGTKWYPVTRFNFQERHKYGNIPDALLGNFRPMVQYIIMGSQIKFEPAANAVGRYQMFYIPKVTELVADGDELDTNCDIWNQFIINDVCVKALTKQESDARPYIALRDDIIVRIQKSALNRDSANTGRVSDVEGDNSWNWFAYGRGRN